MKRYIHVMLDSFIERVLRGYDNGKIAYAELREYLAFANQSPGDYGYREMTVRDYEMLLEETSPFTKNHRQ